ncbi:Uncharacterised protein [Chlamydia abortus]|nr:Uncharacterised protein [Chlamydia abortus]
MKWTPNNFEKLLWTLQLEKCYKFKLMILQVVIQYFQLLWEKILNHAMTLLKKMQNMQTILIFN